ncbi:MAG: HD domain-containing protein [Nitrospira sp.]|nr:HD domain-containing protein [Nitrospira sp.]
MHRPAVPINAATQLIQEACQQLGNLDTLELSQDALESVRIIQLQRLARQIEASIPGHFGHGERTAHYALLLAKHIGLDRQQCLDLHYAALLHDIGLLTLPGHLRDDTVPHSSHDYALLQSHPRDGAALLAAFSFLCEPARLIAHHHERWDGAGYPYGLRGVYIPVGARLLAIADVFDTIASRSTSWHTALRALLASAGSQFDPDLCSTFCAFLSEQDARQQADDRALFNPSTEAGPEAPCPAAATFRTC